jgi:hypothetical protein
MLVNPLILEEFEEFMRVNMRLEPTMRETLGIRVKDIFPKQTIQPATKTAST